MENKNYVKVSTYATYAGVSTMAVYKQIERGAIKSEKIDDVTFIVVNDDTYEAIKESKK
jgi:predicted amino acid racemase